MLNTLDYDKQLVRSNATNMIKFFNKLSKDDHNPTLYYITEYFEKHGLRQYELYNLKIYKHNGIVTGYDAEERLLEDSTYVLNAFAVKSIEDISQQGDNQITISFEDGYIQIVF